MIEESTWFMKTCTFSWMKITKQGAQNLLMKMRNAVLYLKGATVIKVCCCLQQERSWEYQSKPFQLITRRVSDEKKSLFYFLSIISAFVIYCFSSKHSQGQDLFISLRVLSASRKTCHFRTALTLLLLTILSASHIYCWQMLVYIAFVWSIEDV